MKNDKLRRQVARGLALGAMMGMLGGARCNPVSDLPCLTDETCLMEGEGGRCEPEGFCTFVDENCESGRRWHSRAPDSLAGDCWESGSAMGTSSGADSDDATGSDPSTTTGATSTSTSTSTTDDSGDTTGSVDPSTTTADPSGSTTTGEAMSCDAQYGGATDYMLCAEEADTCAFNVTVGMAANCNDVCAMFGGTCVGAQLNDADPCIASGDTTCDDMAFNDGICVCSR